MAGALRLISGMAVVGTAIWAGFLYRSPWIVLLLAISFTVLYVGGKLAQWRMLARMHGIASVLKALMVTLPIQAIVSGVFFLIGVGIGAIAGQRDFAARLEGFDFALAGGLTSENVAAAITLTGADIVDVSSGVESRPGEKDPELIRRFLRAAKAARA